MTEVFIIILFIFIYKLIFWDAKSTGNFYIRNPLIIAHRGIKSDAPENTIKAFQSAVSHGFQSIELDIVSSKDGVIFCSHNYELDKETDSRGLINKIHSSELKNINAIKDNISEPVPMLKDVFKLIAENIRINIEIKFTSSFDFSTVKSLIKLLKDVNPKHQILVSSFNPFILMYLHSKNRKIKTAFLIESTLMVWWVYLIRPNCLNPRHDIINNFIIKLCKNKKMPINAWTVNKYSDHKICIQNQVHGIITDNELLI